MTSPTSSARSGSSRAWLLVVLAVAAGVGLWFVFRPKGTADVGPALDAQIRGTGLMEKFEYLEAVKAFEEVVDKAPRWIPGRVNLGIALLNTNSAESLARAEKLFEGVLSEDKDHLHAHFCLGIIRMHKGEAARARQHFARVTGKDPSDGRAWFWQGICEEANSPEAKACFEKALQADPFLGGAVYRLSLAVSADDPDRQQQLLELFKSLNSSGLETITKLAYAKMGKYAELMGAPTRTDAPVSPMPAFVPLPGFKVVLAEKAAWRGADRLTPLESKLRQRIGASVIVLDIDRDDKPDLYICGAVEENGQARDLLLHNEGGGVFRDVTAQAGLDLGFASLGAYAADYDNDGFPDLFLTGAGRLKLLRNNAAKDKPGFTDETKAAGLDKETAVCTGAAWVDIDQDADLDLVLCRYAPDVDKALAILEGTDKGAAMAPALFLNAGESKPAPPGKFEPLTTKFQRWSGGLAPAGSYLGVAFGDFNGDRAPDLVFVGRGQTPLLVMNQRLLKFRQEAIPDAVLDKKNFHGALTLDSRQSGQSDLLVLGEANSYLLWNEPAKAGALTGWSVPAQGKYPSYPQVVTGDMDLDGFTDLATHSGGGVIIFPGKGKGGEPIPTSEPAGLAVADVDGDFLPDVLVFGSKGLSCFRNQGNGNNSLKIELSGRRSQKDKLRCNADGLGTRVRVYAGPLTTGGEKATSFTGPGQSSQHLLYGLGKQTLADVVSLRWPDGTWQAELSAPAGQLLRITEIDRTPDSCPLLFAWNGQRYEYITDFLGNGTVGEWLPDGTVRPARPEESILIRPHQLQAKDGKLSLKLTLPMDEVTYLDRLTLLAVDHPAETLAAPEERFGGPPPSQDVFTFRKRIAPQVAKDHRGRDVTAAVKDWDRATVDGFLRRSWLGYAEEHWLEMDFGEGIRELIGDKAAPAPGQKANNERLFLCLVGWTDYPYPEAMWAATQAGVALMPPLLEKAVAAKPNAGGDEWQTIAADAGFPAGRTRLMMVEVTGKVGPEDRRLRLRTNMQVFWDQVFLARVEDAVGAYDALKSKPAAAPSLRVNALPVQVAQLSNGGCQLEYSPDGRQPTVYDYHTTAPTPVTRLTGKLTRLGEVTPLLHERDDRFVIFGPGDEVSVSFDAAALPPLEKGWTRSYVLRTWGYCKGASPFTATGGRVDPLPFAAMKQFPPGAGERFPQEEYVKTWNTRSIKR